MCRECTGQLALHMNESPAMRGQKQRKPKSNQTKTHPQNERTNSSLLKCRCDVYFYEGVAEHESFFTMFKIHNARK